MFMKIVFEKNVIKIYVLNYTINFIMSRKYVINDFGKEYYEKNRSNP